MASIVLPDGIKLLSGVEANRTSVIPDVAEPLVTTDQNRVFLGDNATAGGNEISYLCTETGGTVNGNVTVDGDINVARTGQARTTVRGTSTRYDHFDDNAAAGAKRWMEQTNGGLLRWASLTDGGAVDATHLRMFHHEADGTDAKGGVAVGALATDPGHGWLAAEKGFKLGIDPIGMTYVGGLTAVFDVTGDRALTSVSLNGIVPSIATGVLLIASSIGTAGDYATVKIDRFDMQIRAPDSLPYFVAKTSGTPAIDVTITNAPVNYRTLLYVEGYVI